VFSNIVLNEGEHGIDYNFGEGGTTLVNKRMFLASSPTSRNRSAIGREFLPK
jgi:hypothetical protein